VLFASLSHAQCSMDTDCKGDRVCEAGACVTPKSPPAPAVAPAPAAAPAPVPEPTLAPPVAAPLAMQRRSVGMMAGGIVMLALVPVALVVALNASADKGRCNGYGAISVSGVPERGNDCGRYDVTIYGGLILAAGLTAGGIPLYAIGSKKVPVGMALISPWATPSGGGLALRVDL